jgi:hypothetical protein
MQTYATDVGHAVASSANVVWGVARSAQRRDAVQRGEQTGGCRRCAPQQGGRLAARGPLLGQRYDRTLDGGPWTAPGGLQGGVRPVSPVFELAVHLTQRSERHPSQCDTSLSSQPLSSDLSGQAFNTRWNRKSGIDADSLHWHVLRRL